MGNAWIGFRTSFSWVGNNLSLQIHSLCENLRKSASCATRRAILPLDFSLLSWWNTIYLLQFVLIYHEMKPINTLYRSHLFCNQCLAGNGLPNGRHFFTKKFYQTRILFENIESTFFLAACMHKIVHGSPLICSWFQLSCVDWLLPPPRLSLQGESRVQLFDLDGVGSIPAIPPTQITCFVHHFNKL